MFQYCYSKIQLDPAIVFNCANEMARRRAKKRYVERRYINKSGFQIFTLTRRSWAGSKCIQKTYITKDDEHHCTILEFDDGALAAVYRDGYRYCS